MKIYINHFNLDILIDLIKKLTEYHDKTEEYTLIHSYDGIYIIDQKSTIKLNPIDHNIIILNNFHDDFTLIVDQSFFIVEKVVQIPPEHITSRIKRDIFSLNKNNSNSLSKKSFIKLVIELEVQNNEEESAFYFLNKKNSTENAAQYKDIYFEMPNGTNIEDSLVKEEIIEFLSLLN
jgi:hypothetical protein